MAEAIYKVGADRGVLEGSSRASGEALEKTERELRPSRTPTSIAG